MLPNKRVVSVLWQAWKHLGCIEEDGIFLEVPHPIINSWIYTYIITSCTHNSAWWLCTVQGRRSKEKWNFPHLFLMVVQSCDDGLNNTNSSMWSNSEVKNCCGSDQAANHVLVPVCYSVEPHMQSWCEDTSFYRNSRISPNLIVKLIKSTSEMGTPPLTRTLTFRYVTTCVGISQN